MRVQRRPLLEWVVLRLRASRTLEQTIIGTSTLPVDDAIEELAGTLQIPCYRGSHEDVLDRYYMAAKVFGADPIVRITADCPLVDPSIVDTVVSTFMGGRYDYVSNIHPPTFPDGFDVEVFSFSSLKRAAASAQRRLEREHVTPYIYSHPEIFGIGNVAWSEDLSSLRLTVDQAEDLDLIRFVASELDFASCSMLDVVRVLRNSPEQQGLNSWLARNEGYNRSAQNDG